MDPKLSEDEKLERLIRQGSVSRAYLGREVTVLKQRLDFPARIRHSLKSHPTGWLLGSLASGFAGSLLFRRRHAGPPRKHRGLPLTLIGLALTAFRPVAKVWLTGQVKNYLTGKPTVLNHLRMARRPSPQPPI